MDLVALQTFGNAMGAQVLKSYLEAQGIECFLENERIVSTGRFPSGAVGGIRLKVKEADFKRASELMNSSG